MRSASERAVEIDPAEWARLANGEDVDLEASAIDPASVEDLTRQLLEVLTDESATMVPPTAAGMDAEEWSLLPDAERARYGRMHLRSLDPRLLSRAYLRMAGRRYSKSRH